MMKVLHVISGLSSGGAETTLVRLIAGSKGVSHQVLVLSMHKDLEAQVRAAGAPVHFIDLRHVWALPGRLFRVWRFIKLTRPDVVQTWMYHADVIGGVMARLAGVRAVAWALHHASPDAGDLGRTARWSARFSTVLSSSVPTKIVACSETTYRCHARYGYKREALTVIRNGYDLRRFSVQPEARTTLRADWSVGLDECLFGMVARYHPVKGHGVLLDALSALKASHGASFKCVLVGDGVDQNNTELVQALAKHGLLEQVLLCGFRADVPEIMNAIDVLVLSSHSEAFPNVINEAMACGTPCVTTDVGDAHIIVGEHGWVVPRGSPEALATALSEAMVALSDTKRWQARREAARRHIEQHFSLDVMVNAYLACWAGMLQAVREPMYG